MRVVAEGADDLDALERGFAERVAGPLRMAFRFAAVGPVRRVAVLAGPEDHCLADLLWRARSAELGGGEIVLVAGHAAGHEELCAPAGLAYHHVPFPAEPAAARRAAEDALLELVHGARADLLVLARFMRVLSASFLDRLGVPALNIHHSFLPAFPGANPYRRAHHRGVKLVGATAHYVTEDLDEGPIVEQEVARISHRDDEADLRRVGRDVERLVLARAVRAHLEDRVVVRGNRTVVF